jgi:hypothetical protein
MGTHEARPGPVLPPPGAAVLPAVLPAVPALPAVLPAPVAPLAPDPGLRAPSGSSGLVPVRPGTASATLPAGPAAPNAAVGGFVPGAAVTTSAAVRMRWDQPRARTRASATTFGLTGRVVITVVVVVVVAVLSYGNPFGIPLFLAASVWLLRDLWARASRAVPAPARGAAPGGPAPGRSLFATPEPPPPAAPSSFPPPTGPAAGR